MMRDAKFGIGVGKIQEKEERESDKSDIIFGISVLILLKFKKKEERETDKFFLLSIFLIGLPKFFSLSPQISFRLYIVSSLVIYC